MNFPPTFEIAVYLQAATSHPLDQTCAWGVVASHEGDVRQCPIDNSPPARPPERILGQLPSIPNGMAEAVFHVNSTLNYTATAANGSPMTAIVESQPCLETVVGGLGCPVD